mmetsp:Transcript_107555/g.272981  ORF Transcript_107555/g.272981 Transcript_107555/m.272981 type:complete len:222 (-) Transcript_107555:219-884(-)
MHPSGLLADLPVGPLALRLRAEHGGRGHGLRLCASCLPLVGLRGMVILLRNSYGVDDCDDGVVAWVPDVQAAPGQPAGAAGDDAALRHGDGHEDQRPVHRRGRGGRRRPRRRRWCWRRLQAVRRSGACAGQGGDEQRGVHRLDGGGRHQRYAHRTDVWQRPVTQLRLDLFVVDAGTDVHRDAAAETFTAIVRLACEATRPLDGRWLLQAPGQVPIVRPRNR